MARETKTIERIRRLQEDFAEAKKKRFETILKSNTYEEKNIWDKIKEDVKAILKQKKEEFDKLYPSSTEKGESYKNTKRTKEVKKLGLASQEFIEYILGKITIDEAMPSEDEIYYKFQDITHYVTERNLKPSQYRPLDLFSLYLKYDGWNHYVKQRILADQDIPKNSSKESIEEENKTETKQEKHEEQKQPIIHHQVIHNTYIGYQDNSNNSTTNKTKIQHQDNSKQYKNEQNINVHIRKANKFNYRIITRKESILGIVIASMISFLLETKGVEIINTFVDIIDTKVQNYKPDEEQQELTADIDTLTKNKEDSINKTVTNRLKDTILNSFVKKEVTKDESITDTIKKVEDFTKEIKVMVSGKKDTYAIDLIHVEKGTFMMGCTQEQGKDCYEAEQPSFKVTLTKDYYIGKFEVTQKLWKIVMGKNPSAVKGENLPVNNYYSEVSVPVFIRKLNKLTGKKFRLPTEAEWEFAARGGNKSKGYKYAGSNDIDEVAWYRGKSSKRMHPVGEKMSNELGIYDMNGNAWEYVNDEYDVWDGYLTMRDHEIDPKNNSSGRYYLVFRGGCYENYSQSCRIPVRNNGSGHDLDVYGFRLAMDVEK